MKKKPLWLWPTDVPVATTGLPSLERIAKKENPLTKPMVTQIGDYPISNACAAWLLQDGHWSIWVNPNNKNYREVWNKAALRNFVDPLSAWGDRIDVDHILPKSWVEAGDLSIKLIRIFPTYAEVNQSAGRGIEKKLAQAYRSGIEAPPKQDGGGVWYAKEYQLRKVLGLGFID